MKRLMLITMVLVLVGGLILSGCASPAPAPVPAPSPSAPPAPKPSPSPSPAPASGKAVKLVFSFDKPMTDSSAKINELYMKRVTQDSVGAITFDYFHSAQLHKGEALLGGLSRGEADMALLTDSYFSGTIPLFGMSGVPFLWDSDEGLYAAMDKGIREAYGQQLAKHNIVVLGIAALAFYQLITKDKAVEKPADLKGMIVAVSGVPQAKAIEKLGGSPATMESGELYEALQRRTIDATTRPFITVIARRLDEVAKHVTMVDISNVFPILSVNKNTWDNKLSADQRQLIANLALSYWVKEMLSATLKDKADGLAYAKQKGMTVHDLTLEQKAAFATATAPVLDWWLGEVPEGRALLTKLGKIK